MAPPALPLAFLLVPLADAPAGPLRWQELQDCQRAGLARAWALRLYAAQPGDADTPGRRICDAVIPSLDPGQLWLAVLRPPADGDDLWQPVDGFRLAEATNDTCWFYPTNDGAFLSWQRDLEMELAPGRIIDPPDDLPEGYSRAAIAVLWSLLADDPNLTCVGLTYAGRRIDLPLTPTRWAPASRWSRFRVDSRAETPLTVERRWQD